MKMTIEVSLEDGETIREKWNKPHRPGATEEAVEGEIAVVAHRWRAATDRDARHQQALKKAELIAERKARTKK